MPTVLKCILVALVCVAAAYDLRFRRIPNWLNLSGVILGLGTNTLLFAQHGFRLAVLGCFVALALYFPLYILHAMGAGDAKLMSAVGSVVGPQNWIIIFLCTAIAGGILGTVVAVHRKGLRETLFNVTILCNELIHLRAPAKRHASFDVRNSRAMRLPHGVSIAAGSVTFVLLTVTKHL